MIRIAAVGDVHLGVESRGEDRPHFEHIADMADVLLIAGDLTRHGCVEEAEVVAEEYGDLGVPVVVVLGNHDHHTDGADAVRRAVEKRGITVLECDGTTIDVDGTRLGIAGTKGFGGGFTGACTTEFGEEETKAFARHSRALAEGLRTALRKLDCDVRVALTHYSPVADTLVGERLEIYPFLGSYLLAEAIDDCDVALAVHGHAHGGSEKGVTTAGTHVRNAARPVIRQAYAVYCLE